MRIVRNSEADHHVIQECRIRKRNALLTVIIAGMEAHICVMQTSIELLSQDFEVFVVVDAICSRHRETYETALTRLRSAGATILDAESVLFEWVRDARHDHFKALQAMVR